MEAGHGRQTPVHIGSHHRVRRVVLDGGANAQLKPQGLKFLAVNVHGRGGKSHQVTVRRLQAAVAPRLCLVGRGCSQRTFIALLVQAVYSVPDVRRIAHPL